MRLLILRGPKSNHDLLNRGEGDVSPLARDSLMGDLVEVGEHLECILNET